MDSSRFLRGRFSLIALSAVLAITAILPYGCSKENKGTEQAQQEAAPAADLGKEHFEKGVQLSLKGQLDEAIKEYETVLQFNPKSAETYNNLGFAYFDKGDFDKALESQKKAVELNPNLANGHYGLAMAFEKKNDKKSAIESWKKFAELSQPHSKWWMKAQEHIQALEGKKLAPAQAKKK
ncbi:MAG: tetratricopeptide repeat protein [Deltaproteobacteria bacterium]|nr:tetratricopeptide repeat protein [Deltaproteobacteria bacterium]